MTIFPLQTIDWNNRLMSGDTIPNDLGTYKDFRSTKARMPIISFEVQHN